MKLKHDNNKNIRKLEEIEMKNTVNMLLESSVIPSMDFVTENTVNFNSIREATENEKLSARFSVHKIPVTHYDNKYVIEFASGVDRLIEQNNIDINKAMEMIANANNINVSECTLILDESAIKKVDLTGIDFKMFDVARI